MRRYFIFSIRDSFSKFWNISTIKSGLKILNHLRIYKLNLENYRIQYLKKCWISCIRIKRKWSCVERNPTAICLKIRHLTFSIFANSRIATWKTQRFEFQFASVCGFKGKKISIDILFKVTIFRIVCIKVIVFRYLWLFFVYIWNNCFS